MVPIETPSSWFKDTIAYTALSGFAAQTGQVLLQDIKIGTIVNEVVIRPKVRFVGTGLGVVKLELVDEFNKNILSKAVKLGVLVNSTSYYRVLSGDTIPDAVLNTAPDKVYAKFSVEESFNQSAQTTYERSLITTLAGTGMGGKYFTVGADTYVWYNTGGSADPAPGGAFTVGVQVAILTGDTATDVARKTYLALANTATFSASWDGSNKVLTLGAQTNVTNVGAGTSGFTVLNEQAGGASSANLSVVSAGEVDIYVKFTQLF